MVRVHSGLPFKQSPAIPQHEISPVIPQTGAMRTRRNPYLPLVKPEVR